MAPCPVSSPHATVTTMAMPVATTVRRQTGATTGRRRVATGDCTIRIVQMLPTPTSASRAITMWAGTISAAALPANPASAHVAVRRPSTTRPYSASRTATAARPYRVIPKIRPTAQELKCPPAMTGTGARKRHARNPNRKAPRDDDPVTRRTSVPVSAAAANTSRGRTTKWRASSGSVPKVLMTAASSHSSPQWYQVWTGNPGSAAKPDGE